MSALSLLSFSPSAVTLLRSPGQLFAYIGQAVGGLVDFPLEFIQMTTEGLTLPATHRDLEFLLHGHRITRDTIYTLTTAPHRPIGRASLTLPFASTKLLFEALWPRCGGCGFCFPPGRKRER